MSEAAEFEAEFSVGDPCGISVGARVTLISLPPYVKTADPMPTLRSSTLLTLGETGTVMDRRPGGYWGVKFERGIFLMERQYLNLAAD